jgi:hypothetical protein
VVGDGTQQEGQAAPAASDKHGAPIAPGDHVEIPYGGDLHVGSVEKVAHELGSAVVHVKVLARVPAALARKVERGARGAAETIRRRSTH